MRGIKKRGHKNSLCNFFTKNHRGQVPEYLMWLLIALAGLVVMVVFAVILKGTGTSFLDKIKNLFLGR